MRVLFITSRFPGDLRRGDQRRAYEQLRALSSRHAITLLTLQREPLQAELQRELRSCCEQVISVPCSAVGTLARIGAALGSDMPLQCAMYDAPAAQEEISRQLARGRFDLLHLQLARLGPLLPERIAIPCVLDFIDALSLNMQRRAQYDRSPARWLARSEAARLSAYEHALCERVHTVAVSARPDRAALGERANVQLVGNGVDLAEFPFAPHPRAGHDIAFVGNLGYFPNVDAAEWFATDVMPIVRASCPRSKLHLIGARPALRLRRLSQRRNDVELVGAVDRVHPYLARAAVAIAPLRAGSGQQLKILEAMSTGTPVVASNIAAAGLDAIAGRDLLVAEDPAAFAGQIVRVLTDPALAQSLAGNARALVEKRYTWAISVDALERLWLDATATARAEHFSSAKAVEPVASVRHADPVPVV